MLSSIVGLTILKAITIKDSFPIPTVVELLDVLFGMTYFS